MGLDHMDALPDDDLAAPRPKVVVQYRRSLLSRLAPAVLLLLVAGMVLAYRVRIEDWRGLEGFLARRRPEAPALPRTPPPQASPAPPPPVAVVHEARLVIPPRLPSLPRPDPGRPGAPPSRPTLAAVLPEEPVDASEVWNDIRREVVQKKANEAAMEATKVRQFEDDERSALRREFQMEDQHRQDLETSRSGFRAELRRVLKDPTVSPAEEIEALCERQGVRIVPGKASWMAPEDLVPLTSSGRRERVVTLRLQSWPEPRILQELVRLENRNHPARKGPKTRQETVVRAAVQLLEVPLNARPKPSGPARIARPK